MREKQHYCPVLQATRGRRRSPSSSCSRDTVELRITSVETASLLEASKVEADRHKATGNRKFGGKRLRLESLDDAE